jgi:hypothetical protein
MTRVAGDGWRELRAPGVMEASPFARLARTHALAMAGDALVTVALAGSLFFSISPGAARGRVALSLVLTMAPFAVVAPLLGPAIDRSRRGRRVVVAITSAARAVTCLVMAGVLHNLLLFPAAFAALVLSKAYAVVKSAMVPAVVEDDASLVEANAKLAVVGVLAGFLASLPGVLLLRLADARWTLRLAAIAFAATTVSALTLRTHDSSPPSPPRSGRENGDMSPFSSPEAEGEGRGGGRAGEATALHLAAAATATALLRALVGFLTFLVAFAFRRSGAPSWEYGVVLGASMAASLGGAAVAPVLRRVLREERMLQVCLAGVAVAGVAVARAHGRLWSAVVAIAVGMAAAMGKLAFDSIVQRDASETERGRSFARFEAGFQLVWVAGALLPVVFPTSLRQGELVLGVAAALGAAFYAGVNRMVARRGG